MFKVNDYLEVKDIQIPIAYIEEFCNEFEKLLANHSDQLIDVAVLSNVNGEPVSSLEGTVLDELTRIGFKPAGRD